MSTTEQLGSERPHHSIFESIPDPTTNWRRSHYLLWFFVGALLGLTMLVQSSAVEYDFSRIFDRFSVPECSSTGECG